MLKGDPEVAFGRGSFFWQQRPSPDSLSALVHQAVISLGVLHTLTTWVGSCREVLDSSLGRGRCLFQIPKPITGSLVACCSACCDSRGNLHPSDCWAGDLGSERWKSLPVTKASMGAPYQQWVISQEAYPLWLWQEALGSLWGPLLTFPCQAQITWEPFVLQTAHWDDLYAMTVNSDNYMVA